MGTAGRPHRWVSWCAPLFALLVCGVLLWGPRRIELNLADEGFLWYGVERVVAGEVPMRDFQAYDPGRYLWCAALAPLVGDGILGVRTACALFAALGLAFALAVAGRFTRTPLGLLVCALVLGLWLFPRHKLFEPALASAAVWFALRLLEDPRARRYLACGLFVGVSALFGRNHALYSALAFGACALLLAWKLPELRDARRAGALALGGLLGFVPLGAMLLFVPGFAAGYWHSLMVVLEHGANLALPYPFPWRVPWAALSGWRLAGQIALAAAFTLPFVVLTAGLVLALRTRRADLPARAPAIAACFVGLAYVHHASVRSDASHLAQSFPPLLLLALALPALGSRTLLCAGAWSVLALGSLLAAFEANSVLTRFRPDQTADLVDCDVAGERLRMPLRQAQGVRALQAFAAERLPGEAPIWIVNQPTIYALLRKAAPGWWLYFYWPESEAEQRAHIESLAQRGVDWVLLHIGWVEGPEQQTFASTHPLVWRHLSQAFEPVELPGLQSHLKLMRRRP